MGFNYLNVSEEFCKQVGGTELAVLRVDPSRHLVINVRIKWKEFSSPEMHSIAFHDHILIDDDDRLDALEITSHDTQNTQTARSVFSHIAPTSEYCRVTSVCELSHYK